MFTGIVQGLGRVVSIDKAPHLVHWRVQLPSGCTENLAVGSSVAHNGCCLTIVRVEDDVIDVDIMHETLRCTNLGCLHVNDEVNIERAARFGDEIGGHLMSGHIMQTVAIVAIEQDDNRHTVWFEKPHHLSDYILPKGFIGLDGCSLTIGTVEYNRFCVHLIPETLRQTRFGRSQVGQQVNIEIDPHIQATVDTVKTFLAHQTSLKGCP